IREEGHTPSAGPDKPPPPPTRHAQYYTDFVGALSQQIHGPHQIEAGRRLIVEHENVLAAANFAVDTDNADLGLRLARNTPPWGWQMGYELRVPVEAVLRLRGASQHPLYPYGLALAALYAGTNGDAVATSKFCEQALASVQNRDLDPVVNFMIAGARGALAFSIGDWDEVVRRELRGAEEAWSAALAADSANGLQAAAVANTMAGDGDAAAPLAADALAIARDLGTPTLIATSLSALAGALA